MTGRWLTRVRLPPFKDCEAPLTWLLLARFGKVGDTGVRAHQHIARVQRPLQKALLGFRDVNPAERSLRQGVGRDQGQTVDAHLVDAINGLEGRTWDRRGVSEA